MQNKSLLKDLCINREQVPGVREQVAAFTAKLEKALCVTPGSWWTEYRRQANLQANNGKERKDLYTDNWDGSEYKGSPFNILTFLVALFILVPVAGLVFAFATFGSLWG